MAKIEYANIVKDIATTKSINTNTLGAWMQLAKQAPALYEKMHVILTGKFSPEQRSPGVQAPRRASSNTHFSAFVSLSFQIKDRLIDMVLEGKLDTKGMHHECKLIKARQRIRKEVATRLRDLAKINLVASREQKLDWNVTEDQTDEFCLALMQHPWLEAQVVEPWCKHVCNNVKNKNELPIELFKGMMQKIETTEAAKLVQQTHRLVTDLTQSFFG